MRGKKEKKGGEEEVTDQEENNTRKEGNPQSPGTKDPKEKIRIRYK